MLSLSLMANVYYQLDWIYNLQGNTSLGLCDGASGKAGMVAPSQGRVLGWIRKGRWEEHQLLLTVPCHRTCNMTRKIFHTCHHDSSSMRGGTLKCQSKQTPTVVRYFKYRVREVGSVKALSPFHTAFLCSDPSSLSWSLRRHFVWKYFRPQALPC